MSDPVDILITMALCFAAWGFFYAGLHRRWGIDYTRHFLLTTGYFLIVAAVPSVIFWPYLAGVVSDFSLVPLIGLGFFMFAQLLLYVYVPRHLREPTEYFEQYPDRYFLKIEWRRLISKSADILAQQVFVVLLVAFLRDEGLSLYQLWFAFGALFMLLHVPLIASERGAWPSWAFGGIVLVFSVVFPTLILSVPYGFVYNIELHWLFYTALATGFWIRYDRRAASA